MDKPLPDKCMHYVREKNGHFTVYDQFKDGLYRVFHLEDENCFKRVLLGCPPDTIDPILAIRIYYKDSYNTQTKNS